MVAVAGCLLRKVRFGMRFGRELVVVVVVLSAGVVEVVCFWLKRMEISELSRHTYIYCK